MIIKSDIDPKVVWKLEEVAEKRGLTLGEYVAELASAEVERPVVRVDWWEGSANRCVQLMDAGRTNAEIVERLGLRPKTVARRRRLYNLAKGVPA